MPDNGIYILKTKGPEYRVAYSDRIYAIYGEYNDTNLGFDPVRFELLEIFGAAGVPVFTDPNTAIEYAKTLLSVHHDLTDGIRELAEFEHLSFSDLLTIS